MSNNLKWIPSQRTDQLTYRAVNSSKIMTLIDVINALNSKQHNLCNPRVDQILMHSVFVSIYVVHILYFSLFELNMGTRACAQCMCVCGWMVASIPSIHLRFCRQAAPPLFEHWCSCFRQKYLSSVALHHSTSHPPFPPQLPENQHHRGRHMVQGTMESTCDVPPLCNPLQARGHWMKETGNTSRLR